MSRSDRLREKPQVVLSADSLQSGDGGISRVARLMARVLLEFVDRDEIGLRLLVVRDAEVAEYPGASVEQFHGNRNRFVCKNLLLARSCSHFIYDSLALARAHWRLPPYRKPFLSWIYGIEIWGNETPLSIRRRRIEWAKRASALLACSEFTRRRAAEVDGALSSADVCWLGTEEGGGAPVVTPAPARPTVLILGRMEPDRDKGHRALLRIWPSVVSRIPNARLLIVGSGSDEGAIGLEARDMLDRGHVDFRGFVHDEQMEAIWKEASVMSLPSRGEGFGLVYVEAMRYGVPILASTVDAAPEINIDGETGFNVHPDSLSEMGDRLIQLLSEPELAKRLGQAGYCRWRDNFTYERFRDRFSTEVRRFLGWRNAEAAALRAEEERQPK